MSVAMIHRPRSYHSAEQSTENHRFALFRDIIFVKWFAVQRFRCRKLLLENFLLPGRRN